MATSTLGTSLQARAAELVQYIQQGRILDAVNDFYAEGVTMQENNNPPTVGRAANLERERAFVNSVKEWKSFNVRAVGLDEKTPGTGTVLMQSDFEFLGQDGQTHKYDQVSVQTWQNGSITHEKFYYDTGAKK